MFRLLEQRAKSATKALNPNTTQLAVWLCIAFSSTYLDKSAFSNVSVAKSQATFGPPDFLKFSPLVKE